MSAPTGPTALVSLADAKAHLSIAAGDTSQDAELQGFIDAARAFVEFQTGPIVPTQFVEVHSGGGPTIVLDHPPVLRIDSVLEYVGPTAYTLTAAELGVTAGAYCYSLDDAVGGIIARRYTGGLVGLFSGGYRNVQVTYWAGRATVPADVRMAALEDIRGLFSQTQLGNQVGNYGAGASLSAADQWGDRSNPIGSFPRLASLLAGPSRTPSIA